jgi:hypothetical protein
MQDPESGNAYYANAESELVLLFALGVWLHKFLQQLETPTHCFEHGP